MLFGDYAEIFINSNR